MLRKNIWNVSASFKKGTSDKTKINNQRETWISLVLWICKTLLLEEAGWRAQGVSLYYFCHFLWDCYFKTKIFWSMDVTWDPVLMLRTGQEAEEHIKAGSCGACHFWPRGQGGRLTKRKRPEFLGADTLELPYLFQIAYSIRWEKNRLSCFSLCSFTL